MANLVLLMLTILPLVVAAKIPLNTMTIEPITIKYNGTGAKECPLVEQRNSAKQLLDNRVSSMLSLNFSTDDQCGDGLWYKLVSINMSDPLSQCPQGWVEENIEGVRGCGRGTVSAGCQSTFLSSDDLHYTKVCGRAIGYQYGHTDAFLIRRSHNPTINDIYVDGLSVTYGSPRQHLWTYAAAMREGSSTHTGSNCPCSSYPGTSPPCFLGDNWYCESGNPSPNSPSNVLWMDDPLWDGENCEGTCCSNGKSPPWFSVELPGPTDDDIEARICANEHSDYQEDVFIKIFEIYIQ